MLYYNIYTEVGAVTKNSASFIIKVLAEPGSEDIFKQASYFGVMWDDKGYPTRDISGHVGYSTAIFNNSGQHTFQMTNLKPNTTYYVQGFVRNKYGENIDGPVVTFKTLVE